MSPQPGHETIPISPAFYPYSSSASPYPGMGTPLISPAYLGTGTPVRGQPHLEMGTPGRSPKRPLSVIDVHELDPKLEGISLRASAVRKTTFEEPPSDGSPPSKRRRSLSHDYYIVNGPTGEDEETNVKKTEEDEEECRLTMYAGYTPNHSPSLPPANTSGLSQGSATPTASFVLPKSIDCPETEDRSATATVKEETGESSGVSYPDLSNHLRRVESSSSSSGSRSQTGRFPAPSSDVALNSDLSNPLRRVKSSSSDSRPQTGRFPAPSSDVALNPDLFNPPRRVESSSSSSGSRSQTGRFPAPSSDVAPNLNLSNPLRRVESSSSGSRSQGMFSPPSGDVALKGPLMIKNIPAQDELFLAALNQRLEPISQGQDALPRAVQSPVAMPVPLSAVCSGSLDGANAKHTAVPDNTDVSGAQSEVDDEHNGVPIKMEHASSLAMDKKGKKKDVRYKRDQRAVRIKWPDPPQYGYDGTPILPDPENRDFIFITDTDDEELPAKAEATSSNPIKIDDSDDDSDTRISEPEVAIKFKSTSNFGAPFGRM
ncbi:hypothetical protein TrVFT333_001755 [Trichoderma virens FT-333]|nr:hypothetical protein TrVFT333_001755 [Trichoderma virens FT-333]